MKTSLLCFTVTALLAPLLPAANLVGQWTFENASDLTEATVGSPLTLNGTTSATTGVGGDGAINVATGIASYISVPNPIGANGAGSPTRTNQYTIVLDFQIPDFKDAAADNGQFTGLFDFDNGGSDGDFFIRKQANVPELGVSTQWPYVGAGSTVSGDGTAGTVRSGTWYRLVLAADVGVGRSVYLNGSLVGNYNVGTFDTNLRQSMGTAFRVMWDNTATENSAAIISNIALFDARLTAAEVAILGAAGAPLVIPDPQELIWTGGVSGEWSNNVLGAPKNWKLASDGVTQSDFENLDTVLFPDGTTHTTVTISNGDVQPAAVTFDTDTDNYTLTGTNGIKGSTGILTQGNGDLRIENANTHTGDTDHGSFGELTLANGNALQNSKLITYFGTSYKFDGITALTLGGLGGNGDITLANTAAAALALTLGNNGLPASHTGKISGTGSTIIKLGNSIQTLAGPNDYTGGTAVTAGILSVGNATGLGTGPVTLGGVVDFEIGAAVESTVANDFILPAGSGILRMFGSFAPGHAAPTPGTTTRLTGKISGGAIDRTFRFGDTNITSEHDNTTILDNANNDFVGLIQQWRSVLSFTSNGALGDPENDIKIDCANYNGGLLFGANMALTATRSIELVAGEAINSGAFTGTIDGPFTGAGSLRKTGSGILKLNNASIGYAGVTQVNAGTLQVNGTLTSGGGAVTVAAAGTLGGTGTVARATTVNGVIAPGASVGTLSVTGATIINGTFVAELDGATADLLAVTGDLALGATAVLDVTELTPATTFPYVIATYSGALTGTFASSLGYLVDYGTGTASQITLTGKAPTFEDWAALKGVSGFNKDEDGDGIENGIEFVIGGEPAPGAGSNSSGLLPTATRDGSGNLVFVFRRMPDSAYLLPTVEYSSTLTGTWTPYPIPGTVIGMDGGAQLVQVTITSALAVGGRIFARLAVVNPAE